MGSQRSPPQSSQPSTQKKQQSISSFFTATPTVTAKSSKPKSPEFDAPRRNGTDGGNGLFVSDEEDASNDHRRSSETPKRAFEDDNEPTSRKAKRVKASNDDGLELNTTAEEEGGLGQSNGHRRSQGHSPNAIDGVKKSKITGRTSKYLFSSSPLPDVEGDDAEDDEQARKSKERLHQKFVRRLGRPDSIAEIKRRNHFITEGTQEDEDAADEDGDADEDVEPALMANDRKGPPPKKGKDKLTPLDKQVIAIRRKHMDTLLVCDTPRPYSLTSIAGLEFLHFRTHRAATAAATSLLKL